MADVLDIAKLNALEAPVYARFCGDKDFMPLYDIGVDVPIVQVDVMGKLDRRWFAEIMELRDSSGAIHNPDIFYLENDQ